MNLSKHIDRATAIYKDTFSKLDKWQRDKDAEGEKVKANSNRLTREAANEEHAAYIKKYDELRDAILTVHNEQIAKVEADYMAEIDVFYAASGADIDSNDKALLDSGIIKDSELFDMVIKHAENTTMLRVIDKYIRETKKSYEEIPTSIHRALMLAGSSGKKEKEVFKVFKQLMDAPISFFKHDNHLTEAVINSMVSADDYAESAKIKILKAKAVINDDDQKIIDDYEAASKNYQNIQV